MRLAGLLYILFFLLAACGGQETELSSPVAVTEGEASDIQVVIASDDFAVGAPRIPFVLYSGTERVADAETVSLTAFDLSGDSPVPGWSGEATSYSDYEVPYWVAFPELPRPGPWGLQAVITGGDGATRKVQFAVNVSEGNQSPAIGSDAPLSQNRTLETEPDISKLTSGQDPIPDLYRLTVAEAVRSGMPTVVILATPAFCQTSICAPVVNSVEQVFQTYGERANFIHLEIYKEFDSLTLADEVEEWGLTSEPWTFVLDEEGRVVDRFGGPLSPRELTNSLEQLLN